MLDIEITFRPPINTRQDEIFSPLSILAQRINWSHIEKKTRFHIEVGVAYGSDVDKVTRVLLQCAEDNKKVSSSPLPFVRFNDFGNSSLDFQLFFWTTDTFEVEYVKSEIRYKIDAAFRANKVQIPFPQRDVHIKSDSG